MMRNFRIFIKSIILRILTFFSHMEFIYKCNTILDNHGAILRSCKARINGEGNLVHIKKGCQLINCSFLFYGSNNVVEIGEDCYLKDVTIWIEDSNNKILIGNRTRFYGNCQLAALEGTTINIGDDCLFAPDIYLRTGDSHSLIDLEGKRINPSADITISNRVWIGHRVTVTKGVHIAKECVIGTGAVVTRSIQETHVAAAGVPAQIVKRNISWDIKRH